ncbi:MAG: helix-hairpin-helix domain-containing protein [Candidatus Izemoplasma sp.]
MDKLKNIKKEYLIAVGVVIFIILIIVSNLSGAEETVNFDPEDQEIDEVEEVYYIYIDIKGEVNNPGVYKVSSDYRLFQVVNLAGGLTSKADTLAINLSQKIRDELAIYIPSIDDEYASIVVTDVKEGLIDINGANKELLETLPGIGPATAEAILEYRSTNIFITIEDIMNVPGIGEATYNDIKDSITT